MTLRLRVRHTTDQATQRCLHGLEASGSSYVQFSLSLLKAKLSVQVFSNVSTLTKADSAEFAWQGTVSSNMKDPLAAHGRGCGLWGCCSHFGQFHVSPREGKALRQCAPMQLGCLIEFYSPRSSMMLTTMRAVPHQSSNNGSFILVETVHLGQNLCSMPEHCKHIT